MTTTSFMEFTGAQDKHVLFVHKCVNHLQDILFLRIQNFCIIHPTHMHDAFHEEWIRLEA